MRKRTLIPKRCKVCFKWSGSRCSAFTDPQDPICNEDGGCIAQATDQKEYNLELQEMKDYAAQRRAIRRAARQQQQAERQG